MKPSDVRKVALRGRRAAQPLAPFRTSALGASALGASRGVPPLKKLLMTLMILGAMGTTLGAGTFASFNAKNSNAAAFSTGTLVLNAERTQDATVTACMSTNGGTVTDSNSMQTCTGLFDTANAVSKKPGELATADVTLENEGSLTGTLSGYMATSCVDGAAAGAAWALGTGTPCQNIQFSIQEYTDATRTTPLKCIYGNGASTVYTGAVVGSLVIGAGASHFRLTVNGTAFATDAIVPATTYSSVTALATAVQTAARAVAGGEFVTVTATSDGRLQITNAPPASGTNNLGITAGSSSNGLTALGLTAGAPVTGGGSTCTLTTSEDTTHTLGAYQAVYPSAGSGLAMGTIASMASRYFRFTLLLPSGVTNQVQGRNSTFDMSWTLLQ